MTSLLRSFYGKISVVFLGLLLLLSAAYIVVTFRSALRLIDEVEQKLYAGYAGHIASELQPLVQKGLEIGNIKQAIHYMMVADPRVEIYLLDRTGKILAYFAESSVPVTDRRIDIRPIETFIRDGAASFVLGPDPRSPGSLRPFSAAPLEIGGKSEGYVYVILGGTQFESTLAMLRQSYFVRIGSMTILMILVVAGLSGLTLFALLTRRLRRLTEAVGAFERGELTRRVRITSSDEVDRLGQSFNRMADTISADIDRMQQVDKLRRELVANVSHDLRSPLSSIRGYLETILMRVDSLSKEELKSYLDISLRNTLTLERLVDELFELSKLETEGYQPVFEEVQLAELVQDLVVKHRRTAEAKGVELASTLPPGLHPVRADIALLERAAANLMENAIRYTSSGGRVTVGVANEGDSVTLSVSDNGIGIRAEDLPYVFDRFYRGERSRGRTAERSGTGSGLGLAIVKRIAELHGSDVHVTSVYEKGSTFSIPLP
ncbi:MAG TPA: HAMP domain-containing sensor histidine kinase, partial [Spirochaetia bacterium]|nr:HAMP domain-containing sensor histidine kinase [Spirochaetia bacterium]